MKNQRSEQITLGDSKKFKKTTANLKLLENNKNIRFVQVIIVHSPLRLFFLSAKFLYQSVSISIYLARA